LEEAQESNDAARAQQVLQDAFRTDVRPLAAEARRRRGGAIAPLQAYRAVGYRSTMIEQRGLAAVATGL
jgi:L-rhamnose isomerase/sugar isomerase